MRGRQPVPDRRAVVENVECVAVQFQGLREALDDRGQIVEGVVERATRRGLRAAKAGQIRRDHAVTVGKQRDELAEHVAGCRKTVEQE